MHPAPQSSSNDPTGYGDVTVSHRPPPRPAYKTDLAGVWKFDQDDSDDILEKLKEAREGSGGRDDGSNGNGQNSPRSNNGGIHMGGMGSPYPGGTGSGGGNNGAGNPRSRGANGSPSSELSVNNPEIGFLRAMAKKIVTSNGKSKMEKNGRRLGTNACRNSASNGTPTVTGMLNR